MKSESIAFRCPYTKQSRSFFEMYFDQNNCADRRFARVLLQQWESWLQFLTILITKEKCNHHWWYGSIRLSDDKRLKKTTTPFQRHPGLNGIIIISWNFHLQSVRPGRRQEPEPGSPYLVMNLTSRLRGREPTGNLEARHPAGVQRPPYSSHGVAGAVSHVFLWPCGNTERQACSECTLHLHLIRPSFHIQGHGCILLAWGNAIFNTGH